MSCMECRHAHISSHSLNPPHMPMPSVTIVTSSTNDTHIPSPYWLTSTQCKCQWATVLTPITQLEVYVLILCLILGNINFGSCRESLTPIHNFWLTPQVSYSHTEVLDHTIGILHPKFQAFHQRGLTTPILLRPTHINLFSFVLFIYTTVSLN